MKGEEYIDQSEYLIPENMIQVYAQGAFPMADENDQINWYLPEIRTVIPIEKFNIPRSLKKFMAQCNFEYHYDYETIEVIKNCANRSETWISEELIDAYKGLEDLGHLHSISVYQDNTLVGGLYGVTFRGAFFGESMFSKVSQASKSAFAKLYYHLNKKGFTIIDVQFQTDHLKMFGTIEIEFEEYARYLRKAYTLDVEF